MKTSFASSTEHCVRLLRLSRRAESSLYRILGSGAFSGSASRGIADKLLKLKLSEQKPELIIPVSYPALNFLMETGKDLFPDTPVVFSCVGDSFADELRNSIARAGRRNVSGVLLRNPQGDSLKLVFQLQPDTQRVVAVAGATPLENTGWPSWKRSYPRSDGESNLVI